MYGDLGSSPLTCAGAKKSTYRRPSEFGPQHATLGSRPQRLGSFNSPLPQISCHCPGLSTPSSWLNSHRPATFSKHDQALLTHALWCSVFRQKSHKTPHKRISVSARRRTVGLRKYLSCSQPWTHYRFEKDSARRQAFCIGTYPGSRMADREGLLHCHWEDQLCRDVYQRLCDFPEIQFLRAAAMVSPGTSTNCHIGQCVTNPNVTFRRQPKTLSI